MAISMDVDMAAKAYVYIITNKYRKILYTGVTTNLIRRAWQHREGELGKFSRKYKTRILVYYEVFDDILNAIAREKQIKDGSRQKKIDLINAKNPAWKDLWDEIKGSIHG